MTAVQACWPGRVPLWSFTDYQAPVPLRQNANVDVLTPLSSVGDGARPSHGASHTSPPD